MKELFPRRPVYAGFVALYGFWSVAVLSRAIAQYLTRDGDLLPTHLTLLAGSIYLGISAAAWTGARRWVAVGLWLELLGVVVVSTLAYRWPLPYASAWSQYGSGYLWLPLVLPVAGLVSLRRGAADPHSTAYNDR